MKQFVSQLEKISSSVVLSCFIVFFCGCQNEISKKLEANSLSHTINATTDSIIGGTNLLSTSPLAKKVMYLGSGVKIETKKGKAISLTSSGICTATAIAPRILITAAHCVLGVQIEQVFLTTQVNPWAESLDIKEWIQAVDVKIHPEYLPEKVGLGFDIAMIKLSRDLPLDRVTQIASQAFAEPSSFKIISSGYGHTSVYKEDPNPVDIYKTPSLLNMVEKTVEDFSADNSHFSVDQSDFTGICNGDSGGPALYYDPVKKTHVILGVASFVSAYVSEKVKFDPEDKMNLCVGRGTYSNILVYLDWIKQITDDWN